MVEIRSFEMGIVIEVKAACYLKYINKIVLSEKCE